MDLSEAAFFGFVQGLTEFLPVSSSGHLILFQHLMGFKEPLIFFDITVHLGTTVSLVIYFWKDLAHLVRDSIYGIGFLIRRKPTHEIIELAPYSRWGYGIVAASLPTAIVGIFFKDWFESLFGARFRARRLENQRVEGWIKCKVLNRMVSLGHAGVRENLVSL